MTLAADGNFISVEDTTPVSNSVQKRETGGKPREPDVQVLKESLKFKLSRPAAHRSLGCRSSKSKGETRDSKQRPLINHAHVPYVKNGTDIPARCVLSGVINTVLLM